MAASPTRKRRSPRRETGPVTDTSRPSVASPILPGSITCGCGGFPAPRRTTCAGEAGSNSSQAVILGEFSRHADVVACRQLLPDPLAAVDVDAAGGILHGERFPGGERAGGDGHEPAHGCLRVDGQLADFSDGPRAGQGSAAASHGSRQEPERKEAGKKQMFQHGRTRYPFVKCAEMTTCGRGIGLGGPIVPPLSLVDRLRANRTAKLERFARSGRNDRSVASIPRMPIRSNSALRRDNRCTRPPSPRSAHPPAPRPDPRCDPGSSGRARSPAPCR